MNPIRKYPATAGFTLIELMVTISIAAIILTTAVPGFQSFVANARLTTQTNNLVGDINMARGEALKRGIRLVLCRSANPNAASPTCSGTANTWTTGWLVFADANSNATYDSGDTLLKVGQAASGTVSLITNSTCNNTLEFNADGSTNESGNTGIFAICDSRGTSYGRQIQVNAMGRPRLITGSSSTPIPSCTNPSSA